MILGKILILLILTITIPRWSATLAQVDTYSNDSSPPFGKGGLFLLTELCVLWYNRVTSTQYTQKGGIMNIGLDIGFFAVKAVGNHKQITFPSFITRPERSHLSVNGHGSIIVQSESGYFMMGDEAIKIGQGARQETAQWVGSPEWLSLCYGALSELTEATQFKGRIVIGLPLSDYERDKRITREILDGMHTFERNGRAAQRCTVGSVRIVPQAWGAIFDQVFDDNGKIIKAEMARHRVAVIDAGGHNVNFLAVAGLSDIPNESRCTDRGAWTVVRGVRDFLDVEHPGLSRLKDHNIMDGILSGELYDAGQPVDISPISEPIIKSIGAEIVNTAQQHWGPGASTFRSVLVIGGGAYLWGESIKQAFPHAVILDAPEFANARGFAKFANYNASREQA